MRTRTGFAVVLLAVLTVLSALIVRPFLDVVLAAILLAFVLYPAQERLEPVVGPGVAAFALVVLAVILLVGPFGLLARAALTDLPTSVQELPALRPAERAVERFLGVELQVESPVNWAIDRATTVLRERSSRLVSRGLHAILAVLLLLFLLYYLLKDGEAAVEWTRQVTPLPRRVQDELYATAEETTWAVLKGHVFVASLQGLVSGVGLAVAGVPDAAFWTVVMMFLAMVPIVGVSPVLGGAALYLLLQGRPLAAGLLVVYGMTVVAVTDDYLRALVIDRESSLHSGVVLVGVFGAAYVFGVVGLFFGPVLLGLYKATVEVFADYYGVTDAAG